MISCPHSLLVLAFPAQRLQRKGHWHWAAYDALLIRQAVVHEGRLYITTDTLYAN